ncbi:MAG: helix-turn-helix transcriptional regulator [Hyphomicrobiaceae bacterium]|nr:MAG: helix-turn-helix transcriptional regulator [Hyphomicrobiaceae bacterium]
MGRALVERERFDYDRNMDVEPSIAALGAMIAVPARANILAALFDGRALTASELAIAARVSPQTTSSHLAKLVDARLLVVERHGRHRYYRLAGPAVAEALEPLTHISPHRPVPGRGKSAELQNLREARMCYDHLAGRLGVLLTEAMVSRNLLKALGREYEVTPRGSKFCKELGIELDKLRSQRRVFARQCLDWSERKPHLAGVLGAAIAQSLIDRGWLTRSSRGRNVILTDAGQSALQDRLKLKI